MLKLVPALLALLLAGCAAEKAAPLASGAWRPLNPAQWDIDPALVSAPAMPEARS